MAWAIIATETQPLTYYVAAEPGESIDPFNSGSNITIDAAVGTILNIIVYDGESEYVPPINTKISEVPDTAQIGATGY